MTGFAPKLQRERHNSNLASPFHGSHSPPVVQTELEIGKPDDKYEKEADAMADQVMMSPKPKKETVMMAPYDRSKMVMMAGNPDNPTIRKTAYLPGHDPNPDNPIPAHKAMPKSKMLMMAGNPTNPTIRKTTYLQKDQMAGYKGEGEMSTGALSEAKEKMPQKEPAIQKAADGTTHASAELTLNISSISTVQRKPDGEETTSSDKETTYKEGEFEIANSNAVIRDKDADWASIRRQGGNAR